MDPHICTQLLKYDFINNILVLHCKKPLLLLMYSQAVVLSPTPLNLLRKPGCCSTHKLHCIVSIVHLLFKNHSYYCWCQRTERRVPVNEGSCQSLMKDVSLQMMHAATNYSVPSMGLTDCGCSSNMVCPSLSNRQAQEFSDGMMRTEFSLALGSRDDPMKW